MGILSFICVFSLLFLVLGLQKENIERLVSASFFSSVVSS